MPQALPTASTRRRKQARPARPPPLRNAALPQQARPVEAVERRTSSTTGKLSDDTLKALLAVQEESESGAR
jgi:hypothetical protein